MKSEDQGTFFQDFLGLSGYLCSIGGFYSNAALLRTRNAQNHNEAQRRALQAAGEKQVQKREPLKAQRKAQKTRRIPAVQCTLYWAAYPRMQAVDVLTAHPFYCYTTLPPSCRTAPKISATPHHSIMMSDSNRTMCMTESTTGFWVGASPAKGPRWVPYQLTRPTTRSLLAAITSSTVPRSSGKLVLAETIHSLNPLRPND